MSVTGPSIERSARRHGDMAYPARRGRRQVGRATDAAAVAHSTAAAPSPDAFAVEWRPLSSLRPLFDAWRALAARAVEPNVFYEPAFAMAAAPVFGEDVTVALVWSAAARRLVGLFPLRSEQRRYGAKLPMLVGWTHPFAPLGTPLVDRDDSAAVIAALLADIASSAQPRFLLLPLIASEGPFAAALGAAGAAHEARIAEFGRHQRALLAPGEHRDDYLVRALGAKKRKELRRQRRRLSDTGTVAFEASDEFAKVIPILQDFFDLEAKGWKGRAGTAAAQQRAVRAFVEEAITALAAEDKATIVRLTYAGRAIAAGIVLRSSSGAWFWKIAYDEAQASASPGTQLALELTETLLRERDVAFTDSCATAGHPMIDHLWRERLVVADWLVGLHSAGTPFALVRALETLRREAFSAAKRMRDLLRGN